MGRLAIIAGKGPQPADIVDAALQAGETPFVVRLKSHCTSEFEQAEVADLSLGQVGTMLELMSQHGCDRVVMAGKVDRPPLNPLAMDTESMRLLGQVLLKGDDKALHIISQYFASRGFEFVPQSIFLKNRFFPYGFRAGRDLSPEEYESAKIACGLLKSLGGMDVGQSAIIQGERVLAIEAAEGTDDMISRAGEFVQNVQPAAIFVKMTKSAQNPEQDPPGFGKATIKQLIAHGIAIAIIEPEKVFLVENRHDIEKTADQEGLALLSSDLIIS